MTASHPSCLPLAGAPILGAAFISVNDVSLSAIGLWPPADSIFSKHGCCNAWCLLTKGCFSSAGTLRVGEAEGEAIIHRTEYHQPLRLRL